MLLKNPISNTKVVFHRILHSVKSIFSPSNGNYHKIPKSPSPPPSIDHNKKKKKKIEFNNRNEANCSTKCLQETQTTRGKMSNYYYRKEEKNQWSREAKSCSLVRKLKELQMADASNVDHVRDMEEILHYYSRLTCPEYVDIVERFFMDVYSDFFCSPIRSKSRMKLENRDELN
ncbi:hypothetical protein LINPERPRIM_LOCUS25738 [Linum perenne]